MENQEPPEVKIELFGFKVVLDLMQARPHPPTSLWALTISLRTFVNRTGPSVDAQKNGLQAFTNRTSPSWTRNGSRAVLE